MTRSNGQDVQRKKRKEERRPWKSSNIGVACGILIAADLPAGPIWAWLRSTQPQDRGPEVHGTVPHTGNNCTPSRPLTRRGNVMSSAGLSADCDCVGGTQQEEWLLATREVSNQGF